MNGGLCRRRPTPPRNGRQHTSPADNIDQCRRRCGTFFGIDPQIRMHSSARGVPAPGSDQPGHRARAGDRPIRRRPYDHHGEPLPPRDEPTTDADRPHTSTAHRRGDVIPVILDDPRRFIHMSSDLVRSLERKSSDRPPHLIRPPERPQGQNDPRKPPWRSIRAPVVTGLCEWWTYRFAFAPRGGARRSWAGRRRDPGVIIVRAGGGRARAALRARGRPAPSVLVLLPTPLGCPNLAEVNRR